MKPFVYEPVIRLQLIYHFFHMSRKRRTVRFDGKLPPTLKTYISLSNLNRASNDEQQATHMIRSIIQQLLRKVEYHIEFDQNAMLEFTSLLANLDKGLLNLYQLNLVSEQPHSISTCEPEPLTFGESQRPIEIRKDESKRISRRHIMRWQKEKSQSCDLSESIKRREKFQKEKEHMRKCSRNQMVSLGKNYRHSENEDHSEQIQQLLRRKKELLLEAKNPARNQTEPSKTVLGDKKEKKFYGQNDEGEGFQLLFSNTVKYSKQEAPAIKLNNIKVLPGQQIAYPTNIKRRPIVELPTRKTKRRKDVGDTCVLIEQLYETGSSQKLNQQFLIEQACRQHRGVRIATKQKTITSILRLPTVR